MRLTLSLALLNLAIMVGLNAALNIDFYYLAECDLGAGYSCKNAASDQCCQASHSGKDRWGSVQLSKISPKDFEGSLLGARAYSRVDDDDCGKQLAQIEAPHVGDCMADLGTASGGIAYYRLVNSDAAANVSRSQKVASVAVDSVFLRDGNKMFYMSVHNQTRLSDWEELVAVGDKVSMLNFMLGQYDDLLEE